MRQALPAVSLRRACRVLETSRSGIYGSRTAAGGVHPFDVRLLRVGCRQSGKAVLERKGRVAAVGILPLKGKPLQPGRLVAGGKERRAANKDDGGKPLAKVLVFTNEQIVCGKLQDRGASIWHHILPFEDGQFSVPTCLPLENSQLLPDITAFASCKRRTSGTPSQRHRLVKAPRVGVRLLLRLGC